MITNFRRPAGIILIMMSEHVYGVLEELRKKFRCKLNPHDRNSILVYDVTLDVLKKICNRFRCSGFMGGQNDDIAVVTNFYKY